MTKLAMTHSLWARVTAFMLAVFVAVGLSACVITVILAAEGNWYFEKPDFSESFIAYGMVYNEMSYTMGSYSTGNIDSYIREMEGGNYLFEISDAQGNIIAQNRHGISASQILNNYSFEVYGTDEGGNEIYENVTLDIYLRDTLVPGDQYYTGGKVFYATYGFRNKAIALGVVLVIGEIALLVFLMTSAGHKNGGFALTFADKIPFDLYALAFITAGIFWAEVFIDNYGYNMYYNLTYWTIQSVLSVVFYTTLALALLISAAARVKVGRLCRTTVTFFILRGAWRALVFLWRLFAGFFRRIFMIIMNISLTWRVLAGFLVYFFINNISFYMTCEGSGAGFFVFAAVNIAAPIFLALVAIQMKTLKEGGEALAAGRLEHKIETASLYYDFRRHGENLNRVGEGITLAVEERMRSERFKTELITNVSHDIKTPLTSIINYVDLLKKEGTNGESAGEYLEVLERQTAKLKKLTEDIVEASKASAGVVAVNKTRLNVAELLDQSLAEYTERLAARGITTVLKQPEDSVIIEADGRLLWRVFENALSNICKYAMPGTRAYFDITKSGGTVGITVKNVSADELNITADELMERFVRGDASRGSEGSGLGLAIARSLTELQGGTFNILLDGDLFKLCLTFCECPPESEPPEGLE